MGFEGWKGDFIGFFKGLEYDNSKAYFDAHRKQYEQDVKGPMQELLNELEPELGATKVFRINRDIRFSNDKSPYKTNIGATVGPLYVHLDARSFFVATGAHMPDSAWLTRFREAAAGPAGEELEKICERGRKAGINAGGGNPLKTTPRGYPPDHPRTEMLRWREVGAGKGWEIEPWIATREALDRVRQAWKHMKPLHEWLVANVPEGERMAGRR